MRNEMSAATLNGFSLLLALGVAACDAGAGTAEGDAVAVGAAQQDSTELPPGHPPVSGGTVDGGAGVVPLPPTGSGTGAAGLTWEPPGEWVEEPPTSAMRRAQYRVPGAPGDAECVVFYFGPGQGGDATANATRWADQFTPSDGGSSRDAMRTEEVVVAATGTTALLVEVTGTYSGGMAFGGRQPRPQEQAMLLGAIVPGPDANWFFKCTGPEGTLADQRAGFRAMIEGLRPGGELT